VSSVLVDTDSLSEILKGVNAAVVSRAREYQAQHGRYTISTITIVEIVKGFHKVQREERLQEFLERIRDLGYELRLDNWRNAG